MFPIFSLNFPFFSPRIPYFLSLKFKKKNWNKLGNSWISHSCGTNRCRISRSHNEFKQRQLRGRAGTNLESNRCIAQQTENFTSIIRSESSKICIVTYLFHYYFVCNLEFSFNESIRFNFFQELRNVIVPILVQVCSLDDEGKTAWGAFMDIVYHIMYSKIDEKTPY